MALKECNFVESMAIKKSLQAENIKMMKRKFGAVPVAKMGNVTLQRAFNAMRCVKYTGAGCSVSNTNLSLFTVSPGFDTARI
jgi:hypothetical protein